MLRAEFEPGMDLSRAAVAYGLWAVPQLFKELQRPGSEHKLRALNSLCDLIHDPERLYQTVTGGFLSELDALLRDSDPAVRTRTCDLLLQLTSHSIAQRFLLSSSLLAPVALLLDDPNSGCRLAAYRVLKSLSLLPSGAKVLLSLVPKLMLKLRDMILGPTEEIGGKEEDLGGNKREQGDEKGKLGDKKAEVGGMEAEIGYKEKELGSQEEELGGKEKELGCKEGMLGDKEEDKGDTEAKVGYEEEELGDRERELGGKEGKQGHVEAEVRGKEVVSGVKETSEDLVDMKAPEEEGGKDTQKDEQTNVSEEELLLLLCTLSHCSRLDALPALTSDGLTLLRQTLSHSSAHVRREATAAMMALSVPMEGKQQLCALGLPAVLIELLQGSDIEAQVYAAGVFMNALIITAGKTQSVDLGLVPLMLDLICSEELSPCSLVRPNPTDPEVTQRRKTLVLYCLRSLTTLSEVPAVRAILLQQRHRLDWRKDADPELHQATVTMLQVVDWRPCSTSTRLH